MDRPILHFRADLGLDSVMADHAPVAISSDGVHILLPVRAAAGTQLALDGPAEIFHHRQPAWV